MITLTFSLCYQSKLYNFCCSSVTVYLFYSKIRTIKMNEISTASIEETQIIQKTINNMINTRNQQHQITMMDEQSLNSLLIGMNPSQEIFKLILALYALKLPIHSLPKENKATQTEDPTNT
ncbi:unnamed protein product [Schistosoma intercalatum]|nr:unnamed protein product [Schistosoma intercalatum]